MHIIALIKKSFRQNSSELYMAYLEFVSTLATCISLQCLSWFLAAYNFGPAQFFALYSTWTLAVSWLFPSTLSCPCLLLKTALERWPMAYRYLAFTLSAQVLALWCGLLFFRRLLPLLLPVTIFNNPAIQYDSCHSDLKVGLTLGCLCEALAMLVALSLDDYIAQRSMEVELGSTLGKFINLPLLLKSMVSAALVTGGATYTGMYFNPLLASAITIGCRGSTYATDVAVYWLAPLIATVLYCYFKNCFIRIKMPIHESFNKLKEE